LQIDSVALIQSSNLVSTIFSYTARWIFKLYSYVLLYQLIRYYQQTTSTFNQFIEGLNVADLAWGTASAATVTVSFWVYSSSLTGTFGGALRNSAASRSYPFSYTISSANTWEQKSVTIAGDTSRNLVDN
jgi:hypothetical protein